MTKTEYYGMPESDQKEFATLPKHIRREVKRWILWLYQIEREKPALPAIRRIAEQNDLKISTIYAN
jgi:hypothetical protein